MEHKIISGTFFALKSCTAKNSTHSLATLKLRLVRSSLFENFVKLQMKNCHSTSVKLRFLFLVVTEKSCRRRQNVTNEFKIFLFKK